jgi:hypothetical protein
MSTRATVHFETTYQGETTTQAIVYQHSDGYPAGMVPELEQFFTDVEAETTDTRFTDPGYLAAKFVVWLAREFTKPTEWRPNSKQGSLDFLSIGVVMQDPGDIEFRYHVDCTYPINGHPEVTWDCTVDHAAV